MTEVYLMFYQATSQLFVMFNKFLQREDPLIHVISEQMGSFIKKLFGKFVAIHAIRDASDITSVHYSRENQFGVSYIMCIELNFPVQTMAYTSVSPLGSCSID